MELLRQAALVAAGSVVGGLARWGVGLWSARLLGTTFPYGTFLINVTGSLFLGWFYTVLSDRLSADQARWLSPDDLRLAVAVGFTGAYTTFSTFEWESHTLFRDGDGFAGVTYIAASVFIGLLAVRVGVLLARWV